MVKDDLELFFHLTDWQIETQQDQDLPKTKLQVNSKTRLLTWGSQCGPVCSLLCHERCPRSIQAAWNPETWPKGQ